MEFHSTPRNPNGVNLANVAAHMSMRIPTGVGTLAHDSSLGRPATAGSYFTMSFLGQTAENAEDTLRWHGDPEDRVMVFKAPYMSTGIRKSVDRLALTILNVAIIPGSTQLLPFLSLEPPDRRSLSTGRPAQIAASYTGQSTGIVAAHDRPSRRRTTGSCEDLTEVLMPAGRDNGLKFGFEFRICLICGVIDIGGHVYAIPSIGFKVLGKVCMADMTAELGFDVEPGMYASIGVSGSLIIVRCDSSSLPFALLNAPAQSGSPYPSLRLLKCNPPLPHQGWY